MSIVQLSNMQMSNVHFVQCPLSNVQLTIVQMCKYLMCKCPKWKCSMCKCPMCKVECAGFDVAHSCVFNVERLVAVLSVEWVAEWEINWMMTQIALRPRQTTSPYATHALLSTMLHFFNLYTYILYILYFEYLYVFAHCYTVPYIRPYIMQLVNILQLLQYICQARLELE